MCVTSIMGGGTLLGALGAASAVYGKVQSAETARKQAAYSAALDRRQAEAAELNARNEEAKGRQEEEKTRRETRAKIGEQTTIFGAGNLSLDSGSTLDSLADLAELGEYDALNIRASAGHAADAYRRQSRNLRSQADMRKEQGDSAAARAYREAGVSLLSGLGAGRL